MFDEFSFHKYTKAELASVKPLTLAFAGDCVYELYIRNYLISGKYRDVNDLHVKSIFYVKAQAQAYILHMLKEELTQEEMEIVRRGRNAHPHTVPKNSSVTEYRYATAFEALIGYLYMSGDEERLRYILKRSLEIGSERVEK